MADDSETADVPGSSRSADEAAVGVGQTVGGLVTASHVLGVVAGFALQHVKRLARTSHLTTLAVLIVLGAIATFGPDETWLRTLLVVGAVIAVVFWLATQAPLWVAKKAVHKIANPVQVLRPDEAAAALAGALGLPGLTPIPLVKLVIRWFRNPQQRNTELAAVVERLNHLRKNPSEVAMLFTAVPE